MRHYGLIGYPLAQSQSAVYFSHKFREEHIDADYRLYEMPILTIPEGLDGFSVTIPYKEAIIPLLTSIDPIAASIGAVNCVAGTKGYNTDYIGVLATLDKVIGAKSCHAAQALIFGTGGAAKAVTYALRQRGISYSLVSRVKERGNLTYEQISPDVITAHQLLINCTPVGMHGADEKACIDIPYSAIGKEHVLFDCIYNPVETEFLRRGKAQGAQTMNGLTMFITQAEQAWKIWNNAI